MTPAFVLDLDGAVADFTSAAVAAHGGSIPAAELTWNFPDQLGFAGRWDEFFARFDAAFWSGLRPLADGMMLFRMLRHQYPGADFCVCTAPPAVNLGAAVDGKCEWVRAHLGPHPLDVVFTASKWRLAKPTAILIDDRNENVSDFRLAGGAAVLVPRPWNARRSECRPDGSFDVLRVLNEVDRYAVQIRKGEDDDG